MYLTTEEVIRDDRAKKIAPSFIFFSQFFSAIEEDTVEPNFIDYFFDMYCGVALGKLLLWYWVIRLYSTVLNFGLKFWFQLFV